MRMAAGKRRDRHFLAHDAKCGDECVLERWLVVARIS